jgi:ligand-binding sensor domain-containing protein
LSYISASYSPINLFPNEKIAMRKFPLFLCSFLTLFLKVQGQPTPYFEQRTDEDGLSNGFVTSIHQDEKGFLWFGTANGLNRFDGYQFKSWVPEENNPNSPSHAVVWTLYGAADGSIWVGTDKGLNRYDPRMDTFVQYFHDPGNTNTLSHNIITAICEDMDGNLWVGTGNGLNVMQKGNNQFFRYFHYSDSAENNGIRSIVRDDKGCMWFGRMDTLYCFDPVVKNFLKYPLLFSGKEKDRPNNFVKTIMEEDERHLWLSTTINGIYLFDKKKRHFLAHFKNNPNDPNTLSHDRISSFLKDNHGNLWIGSYNGGLNILSADRQIIQRFQTDPFNPVHQNFDIIRNMLQDKAGNIWLGTFYGGAKAALKYKKPFINYVPIPGKPGSLKGTQLGQLAERPDGSIWVPIADRGLALFNPKTEVFTPFAPQTNAKGNLKNIVSVLKGMARPDGGRIYNHPVCRKRMCGCCHSLKMGRATIGLAPKAVCSGTTM